MMMMMMIAKGGGGERIIHETIKIKTIQSLPVSSVGMIIYLSLSVCLIMYTSLRDL